jgi:hypothetical protein
MRHFASESGKSKGQFYTPSEVTWIMAKAIGISPANSIAATTAYDPTRGSGGADRESGGLCADRYGFKIRATNTAAALGIALNAPAFHRIGGSDYASFSKAMTDLTANGQVIMAWELVYPVAETL